MRRRHSLAAGAVAAITVVSLHAAAARADFTATFCDDSASAPWINGAGGGTAWGGMIDSCGTSGGDYSWDDGTTTLGYVLHSAAIQAPTGEAFTAATFDYAAEPYTGDNATAYIRFGYGANTVNGGAQVPNSGISGTQSVTLPDTNEIWIQYFCAAESGGSCDESSPLGVLAVGKMSVTVHDAGTPAVAATGGSLDATGATLKGTQTLLYHATDTGSGVDTVSLSIGSTVLAADQSTCQSASLTPCPATVNGSFSVNTAAVPDGTYPVILTATDVSGDATPVQIATVTVANHIGTTAVHSRGHRKRQIHTKVTFKWDPRARTTRLIWTRFGRLPRQARVTVTCSGRRCPFHRLRASARHITRLETRLRHRTFHTGDRLRLTITAPHRIAERGTIRIRHRKLPITVATRRRGR